MGGEVCDACGHHNDPGARFCSSCGAALSSERTGDVPVVHIDDGEVAAGVDVDRSAFGADEALFVIVQGPLAGSRYALDARTVTIGRHPDSDIFLDDITVSRRHAEVVRDEQGYRVRDVGSLNGTYVNRELVDEAPLRDGDEVLIGRYRLVFAHGTGPRR